MNKKFIYLAIAATLAMPQLLQAQNVGIGTTTPTTTLEVSSHKKAGLKSSTDSAMGILWNYHDIIDLPAGIKGEYKGIGANEGSGVLGTALTPDVTNGVGVTGVGNRAGVVGVGQTGGQAAIMAVDNGADHGLWVSGSTQLYGKMYTTDDIYSQGALVANEDIVSYDSVIAETLYASGGIATDGTITIAGGSPAAGKVLTSTGTSGAATWQTPATSSKKMSIPFAAFTTSGEDIASLRFNQINGGWAGFNGGVSSSKYMFAPVSLPDGAVVTNIRVVYVNNTNTNFSLSFLSGGALNGVQVMISGIKTVTLNGPSLNAVSKSETIANHVVNNANFYYINVSSPSTWPDMAAFKIGYVEITYNN